MTPQEFIKRESVKAEGKKLKVLTEIEYEAGYHSWTGTTERRYEYELVQVCTFQQCNVYIVIEPDINPMPLQVGHG